MMNPVALVENHPACRKNDQGWAVLPNDSAWKPQLVLQLLSAKLMLAADDLLKVQQHADSTSQQAQALRMMLGGAGRKSPPIPYLISNFIQKKSVSAHLSAHSVAHVAVEQSCPAALCKVWEALCLQCIHC